MSAIGQLKFFLPKINQQSSAKLFRPRLEERSDSPPLRSLLVSTMGNPMSDYKNNRGPSSPTQSNFPPSSRLTSSATARCSRRASTVIRATTSRNADPFLPT